MVDAGADVGGADEGPLFGNGAVNATVQSGALGLVLRLYGLAGLDRI